MMNNKYETLLILTFTGNMCVRNQTKIMQRWPRQLPRLQDASSPQRVCPSVTVGGLIRGQAATRRLQLRWKSLNAFWCCNVLLYNLGLLWWSQKSLCLHQCWRSGVYRRLDRKQICRKISCINRGCLRFGTIFEFNFCSYIFRYGSEGEILWMKVKSNIYFCSFFYRENQGKI